MNTALARLARPVPPPRLDLAAMRSPRNSTLDSIIEVVGASAAASLVAEFGGRRLYVPHTMRPEDALVKLLGAETAELFARHFGGDRIVMPADPERAHRRERIIEARRKGLSISAVARETGCTERYVYKVLAQERHG